MDIKSLNNFSYSNPDLKIREMKNENTTIYIIYFETLCDSTFINDFILEEIHNNKIKSIDDALNNLPTGNIKNIKDEKELYNYLFNGFTIICVKNKFICIETKYPLDSGILEASNEKVIKGPKDAFSENYQVNIGLVRKRIRSKDLKIAEHTIGSKSKTKVALMYVKNIADNELINKII